MTTASVARVNSVKNVTVGPLFDDRQVTSSLCVSGGRAQGALILQNDRAGRLLGGRLHLGGQFDEIPMRPQRVVSRLNDESEVVAADVGDPFATGKPGQGTRRSERVQMTVA